MSPFIGPRPVPAAVRLVVLHHAGSSAVACRPLVRQLPDDREVLLLDLPGRDGRHGEAPSRVMSRVVDDVFGDILKHVDPPYALFGHGADAIVATQVGRRLAASRRCLVWVGRHLRLRSTPWYGCRNRTIAHCSPRSWARVVAGVDRLDAGVPRAVPVEPSGLTWRRWRRTGRRCRAR
ncbi:thioesterase II family protein [Actinoallomurus iriomotensis]|uniref:Thioesterase domain-containing protein n=1 Tax=Actinoallomurus iriomotensis TaxID=478107 RepID=A0A9W6SE95_9ACTN|nr:thioesterase domain-containing protein [Actinoallomurus iriomotensis]GLY91993.1 hypothetical protein Airi02_099210 [Actinoallomurus iriomotensis]